MDSQGNLVPIILGAALVGALFRFFIYPALLSPLSKFPGAHWSCHIAPFWLWWARAYEWENRCVLAGHQAKGSMLRLAPNVLSVNSAEGLKVIYTGDFPRSNFYWAAFKNYETHHMVTVDDASEHGARRKRFTSAFSKSAVVNSPSLRPVFQTVLFERFLPILQDKAEKEEPLEVFRTIYGLAMDLFVCWQFGLASGSNWTQNVRDRDRYIEAYAGKAQYFFRSTEWFGGISFLQKLGIDLLPKEFWECNDVCEQWNLELGDKAARAIAEHSELNVGDEPVLFRHALRTMCGFQDGRIPKELGHSYPHRLEVACEMFSFNAAAHEGGAIPLTWATYELSRRPHLQNKLRQELESLPISMRSKAGKIEETECPLPMDIESLPLLDAIIMETLRKYPVIGGGQPRRAPSDVSIGGSAVIPAGTIVSCSAWSLHRNPDVFPDPESWRPERWLESTPEHLATMRRWFFTFSSGSTVCIGRHWMVLALKMILATIYANFTTAIYEHRDMRQRDNYLSGPMDQEAFSIVLKEL